MIPSCDELVDEIKKKQTQKKTTVENATASLEKEAVVNAEEDDEENEDYSTRLGIADSVTSLETLERKGIQLSPWLWFDSLHTTSKQANISNYPDMISDKLTIRWECPVCRESMYVTREDLLKHLNECVK